MHFIQTYSFSGKLSPKGEGVLAALKKKYPEIKSLADVTPAVGIANAYDAMHLTALAIAKAGAVDGPHRAADLLQRYRAEAVPTQFPTAAVR